MLAACSNCFPDLGESGRLEEIIPLGTAVTVCQYVEDGNNFDTTLRLPLKTKEEVIHWLEEFQAGSKTTLRKSKTFPHAGGKLLYKLNEIQAKLAWCGKRSSNELFKLEQENLYRILAQTFIAEIQRFLGLDS